MTTSTPQEIFDTTIAFLQAQDRPAISSGGACKYRGEKDNVVYKCAVGCHIPNEDYDPSMEGLGVSDLWKEGLLPQDLVAHISLLTSLQYCVHDTGMLEDNCFGSRAVLGARRVAARHNLDATIVGE